MPIIIIIIIIITNACITPFGGHKLQYHNPLCVCRDENDRRDAIYKFFWIQNNWNRLTKLNGVAFMFHQLCIEFGKV